GAVDAERAGVQQDAVGGQLALQHDPAGGGIEAKPAARRGGGFVVDADCGLDHIAHAIAEFQIGESGSSRDEQRDRRRRKRQDRASPIPPHGAEVARWHRRRWHRGSHLWISVPVPWLVNNSSRTACRILPSMMTTPCTPCSS